MGHSVVLSHIHLLIIYVNVLTPQPTEQFCLYCFNTFGGHSILYISDVCCLFIIQRPDYSADALSFMQEKTASDTTVCVIFIFTNCLKDFVL